MPDLTVTVENAAPVPFAAAPTLAFTLSVRNQDPSEAIHTVLLRCQLQIEVTRRRYNAGDQERLGDLFGAPERWGQTLRNMLWTHAGVSVPAFTESASVRMTVPCTFDFNIAATKYFAGLEDGDIPLCLMFSGTVFYADADGSVQVSPISWDKETRYRLPVSVWKEMMDAYYPNSAWLCLRRDAFDKLHRYKRRNGIATWEEVIDRIMADAERNGSAEPQPDTAEGIAAALASLRFRAMSKI